MWSNSTKCSVELRSRICAENSSTDLPNMENHVFILCHDGTSLVPIVPVKGYSKRYKDVRYNSVLSKISLGKAHIINRYRTSYVLVIN